MTIHQIELYSKALTAIEAIIVDAAPPLPKVDDINQVRDHILSMIINDMNTKRIIRKVENRNK